MPVTARLSKRFYDVLGEDVFWISTLLGIAGLLIALRGP